jgi:CubicO group peptidase (beta-lactamase class C family)
MHRLTRLVVSSILTLLALGALAADKPAALPGERRAEAFLKILSAPAAEQRTFVQDNFTQTAIEQRGLESLVQFLSRVREDLGTAPPRSVRALGDRVEFGIRKADGDNLRFTVMLGPPPESKIEGFTLMPGEAVESDAPKLDEPVPDEPVLAVAESELPKAIASLMDRQKAKGFTGAVIVARKGKPLFAQAYGEADRASHRANTLDTPFNLASLNKMFTAVLVAQLQEQGKLTFADKVGKFLPDWPQADVRDKVSIDNLLTHTSGLGMYWGPMHDAKAATLDTAAEYGELFRDDAPAAEPDKRFQHSNNGYVLLGLIAERLTGKDYYALVRERIYRPAGMRHSDHYLSTDTESGFALGYDASGKPTTPDMALRGSPAGGGYASANDLLRFATALEDGRLLNKATLAKMTAGDARMSEDMAYGYGFGVSRGKEKHYGHTGGTPGTDASFEVFPESGYVVIVLSNQGQKSRDIAQALTGLVLARR